MIKEKQLSTLKDEIYFALSLIKFETKEIFYVIVYASIIGVLSFLATLSIQFLINSISFTGQTYPVILLSATTVIILLFISALQLIQKIAVEKIEQRLLVRLSLISVDSLSHSSLEKSDWSRTLIVHRFFDVFNYQNQLTKLLLEGLALAVITLIGLLFIIFYHPLLAVLVLVIFIAFSAVVFSFFKPGIETRYKQSDEKYKLASWISFIAESRNLFRSHKNHDFAIFQTDNQAKKYLSQRQNHFNICLWQQGFLYFLQAVGAGVFLGAGGLFVIMGKINLGQLIAVEFIVLGVLYGIASFGRSLESFYTLVVSAKKMAPLMKGFELSSENNYFSATPTEENFEIKVTSNLLKKDYNFLLGDRVVLTGGDGFSRRSFLWHFASLMDSDKYHVKLSNIGWNLLPIAWKKEDIFFVDRPTVFDIDLAYNVTLKRKSAIFSSSSAAFSELPEFFKGIYEHLASGSAYNWADDPRTRLYVSLFRSVMTESRIILIDYLFDELSQKQQEEFLNFFRNHFPQKLLIINSNSSSKSKLWTQEVQWIQD